MKKNTIIFFIAALFLTFFTHISFAEEKVKKLEGKKILMIIAPKDFRDEEYQKPRELFEKNGAEVIVASSSLNISEGMSGLKVKPDILLEKISVEDYSAIVFVGGVGAQKYWDNRIAHSIAYQAVKKNKVLGAICLSPVTLARAGVLKGKRVTGLGSVKDKIIEGGGKYIGSAVEIDGKIITGNGPLASEIFARDIINALVENK